MTSQELVRASEILSSGNLRDRISLLDYFLSLFSLLAIWATANLISGGKVLTKFSILRIPVYIRMIAIFIAIIKDVVAIAKGEKPGKAIEVLNRQLR